MQSAYFCLGSLMHAHADPSACMLDVASRGCTNGGAEGTFSCPSWQTALENSWGSSPVWDLHLLQPQGLNKTRFARGSEAQYSRPAAWAVGFFNMLLGWAFAFGFDSLLAMALAVALALALAFPFG